MVASDLTGRRVHSLTVLGRFGSKNGRTLWRCQCFCGKCCDLDSREIKRRGSCGCLNKKHPLPPRPPAVARDLKAWVGATRKCWNSMLRAVGEVIPAWRDFATFLKDMGPRPSPFHVLRRKDPTFAYGPGNCVWMTIFECRQLRATRSGRVVKIRASDFFVRGVFSWDKWHAAGSPDYDDVPIVQ